jgi:hypothetical protein
MAQGTLTLFEEFSLNIGNGDHDLDGDAFKVMLISNQVGGTPTITAADTTPDSSDYTEVTGTGYTAGGESITVTWTEANGTATFQVTSGATSWTQNGAGPTDIKTALIYNTTHAGTNDAIGFIDMTTDGTTAISLVDGDITITWNPNIFTLS